MQTIDALPSSGKSTTLGSLGAGKAADCVVLDRNPLTCASDARLDVNVDAVLMGGSWSTSAGARGEPISRQPRPGAPSRFLAGSYWPF